MKILSKSISSLEKVMPDTAFDSLTEYVEATATKNEKFNYQIAYTLPETGRYKASVDIASTIENVTARAVAYVPSMMPCYDDHDDYVISDRPGLFPDVLEPVSPNGFAVTGNKVSVLWITADTSGAMPAMHHIKIRLRVGEEVLCETVFRLHVLDAELAEQELIYTNWFHTDCLCDRYNVPTFSDEHWEIIGKFMKTAADHGMNMILTPIFTPALDTAVGGERTTVQLVDVEKNGDKYTFDLKKLKKWIATAEENGIKYFELAPMYTQWGATNAPKIMATENGEYKRIFGWETDAYGEEYVNFLSQLYPVLVGYFKEEKMSDRVYFHISDEPWGDHLPRYKKAAELLNRNIGDDFNVMDALSSYEFYATGAVRTPVVATNHVKPFLDNNVPELWCYYCCGQYKKTANRFMAMPSLRNRILGIQLYKFNIKGFLHWGYNFWNSQYSLEKIDPYSVTDARESYPSGDAFVVYPGENGEAICSLRLEVFYDAIQDLRALTALERKIGREKVLELIDKGLAEEIHFDSYPHDDKWLLGLRDAVNKKLSEK